jgi:hypothetical protein
MLPQSEIQDLTKQIVDNADKLGLVWRIGTGTVLGVQGNDVLVSMDGDSATISVIPVTPMTGVPPVGTRVFVISVPPNGNYLVGATTGPLVGSEVDADPDASGFLTITHGCGYTPTAVMVQPGAPITGAGIFGQAVVDTITSTTFRVRCISHVGVAIATAVSFTWVAYP